MSEEPGDAGAEATGTPARATPAATEGAPAPVPYRRTVGDVARTSLSFVGVGGGRIARSWPGAVLTLVGYVAAAVPLAVAGVGYPQLLGVLAAAFVAVAWYSSPMRAWEARRRARQTLAGPAGNVRV